MCACRARLGEVVAYVEDDGVGFEVAAILAHENPSGGVRAPGHARAQSRCWAVTLTIASEPGGGTQIYLAIPLTLSPMSQMCSRAAATDRGGT